MVSSSELSSKNKLVLICLFDVSIKKDMSVYKEEIGLRVKDI